MNLVMGKLFWIIQVGPKSNHMYLYEREAGVGTQIRRGEGNVAVKAETEGIHPHTKECWQAPEILEEARTKFSPQASGGSVVLLIP